MKKTIIAIIILTTLLSILSGCAEKAECVWCGEENYCVTETLFGEEVPVCRDCEKEIEALRDELRS